MQQDPRFKKAQSDPRFAKTRKKKAEEDPRFKDRFDASKFHDEGNADLCPYTMS